MKAAAFEYVRPADLAGAVKALASVPGEAKPLGGGQSLGPMLNLRLAEPGTVVDVRRLPELRAPVMETWSFPAWHTPVLFAFALACLLAEWGLRRWKGMP